MLASAIADSQVQPQVVRKDGLKNEFKKYNNDQPLTENKASSKKLKRQTKMISPATSRPGIWEAPGGGL